MLKRLATKHRKGFTLLEMMVVVAIIGLLAAIAIPNFIRYQARSRRSEAYANLAGLARAQKAIQAEQDAYVDTGAPFPDTTMYPGTPGTIKMPWDSDSEMAFGDIGWEPEGEVFYSYGAYTGASCGGCDVCFSAVAYGDVDGNGFPTQIQYAHPEIMGGVATGCTEPLELQGPPVDANGNPIFDTVAPRDPSNY